MFQKYPYTDLHELNLDWVVAKIKEIDERLNTIAEEITAEIFEMTKDYVKLQLEGIEADFKDLSDSFDALSQNFDDLSQDFIDLAGEFDLFSQDVNNRIEYVRQYIDGQIVASNARTDAAITANNNYLLDTMSTYLANIKVLNFFTGEYVSIQDMFDYLAMLHVSDSIDYDTMAARNKTYTDFVNMNMTYTNLVLHGNILFV